MSTRQLSLFGTLISANAVLLPIVNKHKTKVSKGAKQLQKVQVLYALKRRKLQF